MAILEGDIKLLKSAVMADTSDGGGAMTGIAVIDGQSNNLFPDTSEVDRALGRVNMRKVFGVAHTTNTDTLLGAHAIITDGPDDPLVNCVLMKTAGWSDERDDAREIIERYLVKGPRFTCRLLDTHYAGSLTVRLYAAVGASDFPAAGDAIVLRHTNGNEQYVRVTKTSAVTQTYSVFEGSSVVAVTVTVLTCDLGQALAYDFNGAPVARAIANEASTYASVYTTTVASGAAFYGIKKLSADADVGDIEVVTEDGIFTPLVPAATIETPIIDQSPHQSLSALAYTATTSAVISSGSVTVSASTTLRTPTAIEPKTISMAHGSTSFNDADGLGILYQGSTAVADIDYRLGTITFRSSSPSYGSATVTVTYKPASAGQTVGFTSELIITIANQGLAYTTVLSPRPAPGTITISYMAQGRWYSISDNLVGKLAGSDSAYGVGTINYTTGSVAMTLGAIPDVGSALIIEWGDPNVAEKISAGLPTKVSVDITLPLYTKSEGITVAWSNGATNYTATSDASGVLSGGGTGQLIGNVLTFAPNVTPSGDIVVTSGTSPVNQTGWTIGAGRTAQLTGDLPINPGTFSGSMLVTGISHDLWNEYEEVTSIGLYDQDGVIYGWPVGAVGTINYGTGVVTFNASIDVVKKKKVTESGGGIGGFSAWTFYGQEDGIVTYTFGDYVVSSYASGVASDDTTTYTPTSWKFNISDSINRDVVTDDILFAIGGAHYSGDAGILRKGWNLGNGAPDVQSAGSVTSGGVVTVSSLNAGLTNAITWYNVADIKTSRGVTHGVFRTASAPLKVGVFQIANGVNSASGNGSGVISGGIFSGTIDYARGIVRWDTSSPVPIGSTAYNAVFLQYLPLDASLLGLETARLPLDGKVPIFRAGGLNVVHNTQTFNVPNPLVRDTDYDLGRVRIAAVKVKTATGVVVDSSLYETDLDAGTITFPLASDLTGLSQPFTVEHRIEDMLLCSVADISGKLTFTRSLTHDYPAASSYVSSALVVGDVFARAYNFIEQSTWTSVWSDVLIGSEPIANFNETQDPIVVTNAGAVTERWAIIFTNTTSFRVVGESVGEIATGNTGSNCAPLNPATGVPYFTIPATGWGNGWSTGNVYRFNTAACGTPIWVVRTVLQGPATLQDDQFTLAFRGDVDRP